MSATSENSMPQLLASLAFNLVLPVAILKLSDRLGEQGPLIVLFIALSFPLLYGAYDYKKNSKHNVISILGFINVLLTGGFAVFQLEGIWFAVKEAAIPLVIGILVFFSAYTRKPLIQMMIYNPAVLNIPKINLKLKERNNETLFFKHLKTSTILLALSFFVSAVLNYVLARAIFIEIDSTLSSTQQATILNDQIAQMNWKSYLVIMVPSFACLLGILWYLTRGISQYTGLSLNEIFPDMEKESLKPTEPPTE